MPTLAGGLVILNAAVVDGPLGVPLVLAASHRIVDLVVIVCDCPRPLRRVRLADLSSVLLTGGRCGPAS